MRSHAGSWRHFNYRNTWLGVVLAATTLLTTGTVQAKTGRDRNGTGTEGAITVTGKQVNMASATSEHHDRRPLAGVESMVWGGEVDATDIDFVCAQSQFDWSNIDESAAMDLSADIDGDFDVDADDVAEIVEAILATDFGDANLDGAVDTADLAIVDATIKNDSTGCNGNRTCGWADGDFNCDGVVDGSDRTLAGGAPPLDFFRVVSVANHAASGTFGGGPLEVPIAPSSGAAKSDIVEPRQFFAAAAAGGLRVRVDFAELMISGSVTSNPALTSLAATPIGNSLTITFDEPETGTCYTFDLTGSQAAGGVTIDGSNGSADTDFCICYIEGDANRNGIVDTLDLGAVVAPSNLFETMDSDIITGNWIDLNRTGVIDTFDTSVIVAPSNLFNDFQAVDCP